MKPLVIILLGPPGIGKGTQAVQIAKALNLPHISTGDLFRDNIKRQTPLGIEVTHLIESGKYVSDDIVLNMLFDRVSNEDCKMGYILDGCPRTEYQAEALTKKFQGHIKVVVVNFTADDQIIITRVSGRLVCKKCGSTYHTQFKPPKKADICDNCHSELTQRKDDKKEVVMERLRIYHKDTAPLIHYYQKQGTVHIINCEDSVEEIFNKTLECILLAKKEN